MSVMRWSHLLSVCVVMASSTAAAQAQSCMSLSELMRVGIGQSPEVAVAQSRLDQAEADIDEARSLRRPQVTSFGRTDRKSVV